LDKGKWKDAWEATIGDEGTTIYGVLFANGKIIIDSVVVKLDDFYKDKYDKCKKENKGVFSIIACDDIGYINKTRQLSTHNLDSGLIEFKIVVDDGETDRVFVNSMQMIDGDSVIVNYGRFLRIYNIRSYQEEWSTKTSPTDRQGYIEKYVLNNENLIYSEYQALKSRELYGKALNWALDTGSQIVDFSVLDKDIVYVSTEGKKEDGEEKSIAPAVLAISTSEGKELKRFSFGVPARKLLVNNKILYSVNANTIYSIK